MSYGHADNLARGGAQRGEPEQTPPADRPPETTKAEQPTGLAPDWYTAPELKPALAGRDIGALYRWVNAAGVVQRRIAVLTGSSQSEVADIMTGRRVRVMAYDVFERAAEGLAVPRERMGLSYWGPDGHYYGPEGTYPGGVPVTDAEGAAEVLRRQFEHLLALGAVAAVGGLVPGVGELDADLPVPALAGDVPSRIGMVDVAILRRHRENLRDLARTYGGQGRAAVALTDWADHWLIADASEDTRRALQAELAELHTTTAWCCHDCGAPGRALYHFARAVELATDAGDPYQAAYALQHAGMMLVDRERPNEALKAIYFGSVRLLDAPRDDPRVPVLRAECDITSAFALSRLDDSPSVRAQAREALARARDGWVSPGAHADADMHLTSALTWLYCGKLDTAESAVTVSARTFGQSGDRREGVVADLTRARLHVLSGDSGALRLAHSAIKATTQTRSGVARQIWLPPLAEALESRRGGDYAELARTARRVATSRV
ncbi:MAG: hypothetical protein ACRDSL_14860 [Pseudonocardiaceae bacterium]